jgi:hypothetical protein
MKRKTVKYYLIGVVGLAAVVGGLEGCASPSREKAQAAEMLEQKYQEKFEITDYKAAGILEDYYTVKAYSTEYPELLFQASIDSETGAVMDSYVTKRLCDRLSDKISQNLRNLECDYYVFAEAMLSDSLIEDPNVSLETYQKEEPWNRFTIYLCMDQDGANIQNIVSSLADMLNGTADISGSVSMYLGDAEMLAEIQNYVTSHDDTYSEFDEMTENVRIGSVPFENGHFSLTEDNFRKMAGDLI